MWSHCLVCIVGHRDAIRASCAFVRHVSEQQPDCDSAWTPSSLRAKFLTAPPAGEQHAGWLCFNWHVGMLRLFQFILCHKFIAFFSIKQMRILLWKKSHLSFKSGEFDSFVKAFTYVWRRCNSADKVLNLTDLFFCAFIFTDLYSCRFFLSTPSKCICVWHCFSKDTEGCMS